MPSVDKVFDQLRAATQAIGLEQNAESPACVGFHTDFGIPTTPVSDEERADMKARVSAYLGIDLDTLPELTPDVDAVEYSQEHAAVHSMIAGLTTAIMNTGRVQNADDLVALAITIGRRYGMIETAKLMDSTENGGNDRIPGDLL